MKAVAFRQPLDEQYVSLRSPEVSYSVHAEPPSASSSALVAPDLRSLREGGAFSGLKPIKVRLTTPMYTDTGSAATANTLSRIVQFTSTFFSEIASYSALYDEARVLSVKLLCQPFISTNATVAPFWSFFSTSLEFDTLVAAPGSLIQPMEASHHLGPLFLVPLTNSATQGGNGNPVQFHTLRAKLPGPSLAIIDSTDCPGTAWFTLDSGTNVQLFNHRAFLSATGSTGVTTLASFYVIECEFRMRT
jgi:hypothetical protein